MPRKPKPSVPLFDQLLFAPDRERVPGAWPVVSVDAELDEPEFLATVEEHERRRLRLVRRGREHGSWAELDLRASGIDPRGRPAQGEERRERWEAARPIVLPGAFEDRARECGSAGLELGRALARPGTLAQLLAQRSGDLPGELGDPRANDSGDGRVLEKLELPRDAGPALWLASARLSDAEGDDSLRLRVSFGAEVEDDASTDEEAHRLVARLAEALVPGALGLDLAPELGPLLGELVGGSGAREPYLTQHIAYWNAPGGGALMHHDAFDAPGNAGQRGVVYVQLAGATAWLALSTEELAARVEDYAEGLEAGASEWVRKALWPDRRDFERVLARVRDRRALRRELVLPGCGVLGGLVNYGPDFTAFLADAGHAFVLEAGDALLMPSHSLERCVLHSVFCAEAETTYAISAALRGGDPQPSSSL